MPPKVLIFAVVILLIGLLVLFKCRQPKLIDVDLAVDSDTTNIGNEISISNNSHYNLCNEIESFMTRQTKYVMS